MLKGFKEFVMRGNVVDLAVAVVIGAAFGTIVTAIVDHLINPLIAAIFGKPDISKAMTFTVNNAEFSIGAILQAALNFLFIAAAVYFFIVMPLNKLAERRARGQEPEPEALTTDQELLTEIRDLLRTRQ
jgi:large conductance mechanosensitive channel